MSEGLDLVEDPVYDKSVILDSIRLFDPILIDNKLGDTNKGVPGRLLGKHQFYMDIGANSYICDTIEFGYKLVFLDSITPPRFSNLFRVAFCTSYRPEPLLGLDMYASRNY